ncbi:hypothetical protein [Verrucomicrobium spinosum]|uniref:hypothetical protein n=1 Tax=Verrucomicrobium spinosum TaxID=2736 RepID=UPI0012E2D560|nr:hypothetical protein [Verrucomicrobium spinosum]
MKSLAALTMFAGIASLVVLAGCRNESRAIRDLPQRAYVWQRDWNAPVARSLQEGRGALDGCVVLGAEVEWRNGLPVPIRPRSTGKRCGRLGNPSAWR